MRQILLGKLFWIFFIVFLIFEKIFEKRGDPSVKKPLRGCETAFLLKGLLSNKKNN
jgi:hypothetical protein